MKVLVVEDDRKIKTEIIDDVLTSLGHDSDWAQNQQAANTLLDEHDYDLVLLDLQIPLRQNGKDLPEFGKNLLKQIRARPARDYVPVILMTAQHHQCVDLLTTLNDIGLDGSIAKPFPDTGRTLAVVIEEVREKYRRFRQTQRANEQPEALQPFQGGVLAFHPDRIELCGQIVAERSRKGHAWRILHILREVNERGRYVALGSTVLAAKLDRRILPNTLIRAIGELRKRISRIMKDRLGLECPSNGVIVNDELGYHLGDWIVVEVYDEVGTLGSSTGASDPIRNGDATEADTCFSERQRWVLAQLAADVKLTRRAIQEQFNVSDRTAKRDLRELTEAGLVEFEAKAKPGHYRRR